MYRARLFRLDPFIVHTLFISNRYRAPCIVFAFFVEINVPVYSMYIPGAIVSSAKSPSPDLDRFTRSNFFGIGFVRRIPLETGHKVTVG